MQITLDQEKQRIIINSISIPASISGSEGERIAIFEPNKEFWGLWRQYEDKVIQTAPSDDFREIWGDKFAKIKKLGRIEVWYNAYNDSFKAYYDELDLFGEHLEKWKKKHIQALQPIKQINENNS